jgi:hypothetical protein
MTAMEPWARKRVALKVGLLASGLLLALAPAAASAEPCSNGANGAIGALLVETIEHTELVPGDEGVERHARATERGDLAGGCGSLESFQGRMMVHAESWIPVDPATGLLGLGSITGTFHILPEAGQSSVKGVLEGALDFTQTHPGVVCPMGCPWVLASGWWKTAGKNVTQGMFGGLALVPAPCLTGEGLCYYDPTGKLGEIDPRVGAAVVPLTDAEMIPAPSAKFIVTLYQ